MGLPPAAVQRVDIENAPAFAGALLSYKFVKDLRLEAVASDQGCLMALRFDA